LETEKISQKEICKAIIQAAVKNDYARLEELKKKLERIR